MSSKKFVFLIESASGMCISLDYQPIKVNAEVATDSYATDCNCKDKAKPSIDLRMAIRFKT